MHAFEAEFDFVYNALRRHGISRSDAEDLAQDVFLVMWRRWAAFDPSRPLRPWLAGIAFRVAHDFLKRRWREIPVGPLEGADGNPQPDDSLAEARARSIALQALSELPEKHRTLLVLSGTDGLTMQEIAEELGVPLATAYTRVRRARLAFTAIVERLEQRVSLSGRGLALAPGLGAEAVATVESAPATARARVLARLRAIVAAHQAGRGGGPALAAEAAAVFVVVALGALAVHRVAAVAMDRPAGGPSTAHASTARPARGLEALGPGRAFAPGQAAAVAVAIAPGWAVADRPDLGRGLVGYWRFDDGAGSTMARDLSGKGNHCLLRSLDPWRAWVEGARGGGVDVGGGGFLECPQPALPVGPPRDLTVAAWVKRRSVIDGHSAVVTRHMGNSHNDLFFFGFVGDRLKVSSRAWFGWLSRDISETLGQWVHVAFTHRTDGTLLYFGGVEIGRNGNAGYRGVSGGKSPLMIGAGLAGFDGSKIRQQFDGVIDELCLYDRALSFEEIAALAAGKQPSPPP